MSTVNIKQIDGPVPVSGNVAVNGSIVGVSGTVAVSGTSLTTIATANSPSDALVFPTQITVATTATQFASQAVASYAMLQAESTNTASIRIGPAAVSVTGTIRGIELTPGGWLPFEVKNLSQLYHISVSANQLLNVKVV